MFAKKIILFIIIFTVTELLFGEELEFITVRKTNLYYNSNGDPFDFNIPDDVILVIDKGEKVKASEMPYIYKKNRNEEIIICKFIYNNKDYFIDCADLTPANSADTFDPSFISDLSDNNRKIWVPAYYITVLQSRDRYKILKFNKYFREFEWYQGEAYMGWYDYFDPKLDGEFIIYNSVLLKGVYNSMIIKNIKQTDNGYVVTVKYEMKNWERFVYDDLNLDLIKEIEYFDMILCIDGEYMDVYFDDMEHKLTTFALVDQIFLKELISLVENEEADLSKVYFPRRANGSIDNYLTQEFSDDVDFYWVGDKIPESPFGKKAINQNYDEEISMPLWVWNVIIIGTPVVIGGGAVLFIERRRKNRKIRP